MSELNRNQLMKSVQETMQEITEILAKSEHMRKDDEQEEQPQAPEEGAPEEQAPEQAQPEMAPEAEGAPEEMSPEAPEAEGDHQAEMAAHAKELSDEELDMMLDVLMAEKESRGQEQAPAEGEQAPQAPAAPDMAEKSMKEDMLKLTKSMEAMAEALSGIQKDVSTIKTAAPAKKVVTTKPAMTSKQQVLQKSAPAAAPVQRLSKSESIEFLINEQKKGNQNVNSKVITDFNYAQSQDEINSLQDSLTKQGVQFPKL